MTNKKGNYANPYINKLSRQRYAESEHEGLFILPLSEGVNRGETNENKIISKNTIIKLQELGGKRISTHIKKQIYIKNTYNNLEKKLSFLPKILNKNNCQIITKRNPGLGSLPHGT